MANRHAYECDSCGYSAEVSGGPDRGRSAQTLTMVCTRCKHLHDVLTGVWEPLAQPTADGQAHRLVPHTATCELCASGDALVAWTAPGRKPAPSGLLAACPRCPGSMRPAFAPGWPGGVNLFGTMSD